MPSPPHTITPLVDDRSAKAQQVGVHNPITHTHTHTLSLSLSLSLSIYLFLFLSPSFCMYSVANPRYWVGMISNNTFACSRMGTTICSTVNFALLLGKENFSILEKQ